MLHLTGLNQCTVQLRDPATGQQLQLSLAVGCGPTITCVSGSAVPMFGTAHNIGGDQFICSVWCDSV